MSFLNPILLLGLLAIAVPVVIHLRNRRRVERVRWGAMRFLQVAVERSEKRMRAEDWLLLLVRCAVVGLLALAMARPSCREVGGAGGGGAWGQAKVVGVMLVDVSGSMGVGDGVRRRLEIAKEAAEKVLRDLPGGSRIAVWAVAGDGGGGGAAGGVRKLIEEPTADLGLVRKVIAEIAITDASTRLEGSVAEALRVLGGVKDTGQRELYVLTDGQRSGTDFGALSSAISAAAGDAQGTARVGTTVVLVGRELSGNVGVSDVRPAAATGVVTVGRQVRYAVTVSNYGPAEVREVRVVLRVNVEGSADRIPPPVDEGVIDVIGPGESKAISLYGRFASAGMHGVRAEVVGATGLGGDGTYAADDERTIVTRVVDRVRLLLVDGDPGREPRDGQGFYLRQALAPSSAGGGDEWFLKVDVVNGAEFDGARLDEYDAVVLAGVRDVPASVADGLARFVDLGGGLVFFPGAGTQREAINRELFDQRGLLPAALGTLRGGSVSTPAAPPSAGGDVRVGAGTVTLAGPDSGHAIVAEWRGNPAELGTVTFYRWFELREAAVGKVAIGAEVGGGRAPAARPAASVVLRHSDGSAAVLEKRFGRGRVVQFSSTATTQWNDLPIRPGVFVPLVYKVLGAVVGEGADESLNVLAGREWLYRPNADWLTRDIAITGPHSLIPDQSPGLATGVRTELVDGETRLAFAGTDRAGVYVVQSQRAAPGGQAVAAGAGDTVRFAAVRDPSESETRLISTAEREALRASARIVEYDGGPTSGQALAGVLRGRTGTELWWLLAAGVLTLAIAETWMAWRFSRPK